jgi:hypothetical protein
MSHLRAGVERVLHDLLVAPHPETRLALLPHAARLAAFLGRRDTADVLLPSLITFFNSSSWQVCVCWGAGGGPGAGLHARAAAPSGQPRPRGPAAAQLAPRLPARPPQVRAALYACLEGVCPWLGPEGVARIVAPFLDRMVGDPQPAVAAQAAAFLAGAARRGLLRKRHLLDVAARLCARQALGPGAPAAVRAAAVQFLAAAAAQLPQAAVHAQLLPLVLPHLASEPLDLQVGGGRAWLGGGRGGCPRALLAPLPASCRPRCVTQPVSVPPPLPPVTPTPTHTSPARTGPRTNRSRAEERRPGRRSQPARPAKPASGAAHASRPPAPAARRRLQRPALARLAGGRAWRPAAGARRREQERDGGRQRLRSGQPCRQPQPAAAAALRLHLQPAGGPALPAQRLLAPVGSPAAVGDGSGRRRRGTPARQPVPGVGTC